MTRNTGKLKRLLHATAKQLQPGDLVVTDERGYRQIYTYDIASFGLTNAEARNAGIDISDSREFSEQFGAPELDFIFVLCSRTFLSDVIPNPNVIETLLLYRGRLVNATMHETLQVTIMRPSNPATKKDTK